MSEWFMRHIIWFMVHLNGNYLKIMFSLSRNYEDVMSSLVRFWLGAFLGKRSPQNNPTYLHFLYFSQIFHGSGLAKSQSLLLVDC